MFYAPILLAAIEDNRTKDIDSITPVEQYNFTISTLYNSIELAQGRPSPSQPHLDSASEYSDNGSDFQSIYAPFNATTTSGFINFTNHHSYSTSNSSDGGGSTLSSISMSSIEFAPVDWSPTTLSHNGTDYTIHGILGRGAYGEVVYALTNNGEQVAIKICSKSFRGSTSMSAISNHYRQVMNERDILVRIAKHQHRNAFVAAPLACFQDEENVYLVMRMYDQTLTRAIYSHTLCAKQIKVFAVELLLGLESLHCMGIVHRDMKPDNVLVTPNGHLAIADFGLARMFTRSVLPTMRMYEQCGTTGYMSPEVISDRIGAQGYSSSADVWGYGMILYEMLIGRRALGADTLEKQEILNGPPPTTIHGDIDRQVGEADALAADLLHQLLELKEAKRPSWPAIRRHAWFADVDWDAVEARKCDGDANPVSLHELQRYVSRSPSKERKFVVRDCLVDFERDEADRQDELHGWACLE